MRLHDAWQNIEPELKPVEDDFRLKIERKGRYLVMNANTKLELIRELAQSRALELQPFAGEEMNLPQNDPHRDGFVAGERALALRILEILNDTRDGRAEEAEPVEEEMILGLGQT